MQQTFIIGVDIGTTSTKAVLFSLKGQPIKKENVGYSLLTPTPTIAEQDPDEIFSAVVKAISNVVKTSNVDPANILGVSFSSAMHSLIAVDEKGRPLTNCITWADNRSATWAQKIKQEMNGYDIYRRTGTPIHPMSPLAKITWLRHEHRELFSKTSKFISIKECVFFRLFRQYIVDYSIASSTGLFNLHSLNWDSEALQVAGITKEMLSKPVPTTTVVRGLSDADAKQLNLLASTPFIVGASDGVLSNLGVNAIDPGTVAVTIGTSGAIRAVTDQPVTDPKERIFCYALTEEHWVIGGGVNNGGIAFRWVRDILTSIRNETTHTFSGDAYEALTKIAGEVCPGSDGLIFHPYLAGERAPLWNPDARGSFFGFGLHHRSEHLVRAVLEGVIYNLYDVLVVLKEVIGSPKKIQATGGFAKSSVWRQMMADIFDHTITVPKSYESSCLGAALLGLYALGEVHSLNVVSEMVGTTYQHTPIKKHVAIYRGLLPIYTRLTKKFTEEYHEITTFQKKRIKV